MLILNGSDIFMGSNEQERSEKLPPDYYKNEKGDQLPDLLFSIRRGDLTDYKRFNKSLAPNVTNSNQRDDCPIREI